VLQAITIRFLPSHAMAINEDVPGLEVTVRCDGRPLNEFEDPDAADNDDAAACPTASKYVECVDDVEFVVAIAVNNDYEWGYRNHVLLATVYVDGTHIRTCVIRDFETRYGVVATRLVKGQEVAATSFSNLWSLRKFKFATVKTSTHPISYMPYTNNPNAERPSQELTCW
jgi:hypothetical protein